MLKKISIILSVFFLSLVQVNVFAEAIKLEMQTTKGTIEIELFADKAPESVKNFLAYVDSGFYEGTLFHRVINGFMIQGGGYDQTLNKKATQSPIRNEADNGLKNDRGTLAMARTSDPHSATAQFFINLVDNDFLNFKSRDTRGWGYAVFGKVTKGMDTVDQISEVFTASRQGMQNVPEDDVVITKVSRL